MDRRSFLQGAALSATAAIPFTALIARAAAQDHQGGVRRGHTAGYGPLFPTADGTTGLPLLLLPEGFKYVSFGWTRDLLDNGQPTPGSHDGMAAFAAGAGRVRLVRNHEVGRGVPFSTAVYDAAAGGGTTTLEFDTRKGESISARDSISGTVRNCAGGPTPWGTWLTCEETNDFTTMPHGYVFEVPADGLGDPQPLRDMGRFSHEAVAVDPATGYVYETEDAGSSSGFYRYVPNVSGDLAAGGELSMLKVQGITGGNLGASFAHYAHYFFASITAHMLAMLPPFVVLVIAVGVPPMLAVFSLLCLANLTAGLTHYGTTTGPILFSQNYVSFGDWWRTGFIVSVANLFIWLTIGFWWWRLLGLW